MAQAAKEITAFRTEDGLFQFSRMPFGLTNAPASFQRLVNALFGGLRSMHLQVFIDDICLASKTWSDGIIGELNSVKLCAGQGCWIVVGPVNSIGARGIVEGTVKGRNNAALEIG